MASLNRTQGKLLEKVINDEFDALDHAVTNRYYEKQDEYFAELQKKYAKVKKQFKERSDAIDAEVRQAMDEAGLEFRDSWHYGIHWPDSGWLRLAEQPTPHDERTDVWEKLRKERRKAIRQVQLAQLSDTAAEDVLDSIPTVDDFFND